MRAAPLAPAPLAPAPLGLALLGAFAFLGLAGCEARPVAAPAGADSAAGDSADLADCPLDACDGACVDLDSDPANCGGCGRTCLVTNGEPACVAGACALADCAEGWGDCDGDLVNGCEEPSTCAEGAACLTECGSTGATACADVCAPTCVIPAERCNALDDDCDGDCDEGALPGCRAAVYRSYGALGHVYGTDPAEVDALGQRMEQAEYFFVYAADTDGLSPLYRCDKGGGRRLLTLSAACETGAAPEAVVGWVAGAEACGAVPLYRLYKDAVDNHFYTTSAAERDNAVTTHGYSSEGVAAWVWPGR